MTSKRRRLRALAWLGGAGAAALACAAVFRITGRGLACPFWRLTGLYCPGCGVSRMCLRLLRLDFSGAFRANRLLFLTLPLLAGLLALRAVRHVRGGRAPRWEERLWLALAGAFLVYGLARNLPALALLAPA